MATIIDFNLNADISSFTTGFHEQLWQDFADFEKNREFVFLTNTGIPENITLPSNIIIKELKSSSFLWLDQKRLYNTLLENNASEYIALQNDGFSLFKPSSPNFRKKDFTRPVLKIVFSEYHKTKYTSQKNETNCEVIKPSIRQTAPLSWAETEKIKIQYSAGFDYFLFLGNLDEPNHIIELLKAFSVFKKWQQSTMKLVLAGYATQWTAFLEEKITTYKYRDDVVLLKEPEEEELKKLVAASYAMVYSGPEGILPLSLLYATQCGVAVIATDNLINREFCDDCVWVKEDAIQEEFSKGMILLYKDEDRKKQLVLSSKTKGEAYTRNQMLRKLAETLYR